MVASAASQMMLPWQFVVPDAVQGQPAVVPVTTAPVVPAAPAMELPESNVVGAKPKKTGRCWKCAVNTHPLKIARRSTIVWCVA
jgi:hypothetical protein